jgi:hypothetical protein
MSITTYTELKSALDNWSHRTQTPARAVEFIDLCEADLQVDAKLVDLEASATVVITAGSGNLPADYIGARAVYWDGNLDTPLEYVTPDRYDALRNSTGGTPNYYTVLGAKLLVNQGATGNAVMTYSAKFVALSASPSNAILASYPGAYLWGSLKHLAIYARNAQLLEVAERNYALAIARITKQNNKRKYPGPLVVRPR